MNRSEARGKIASVIINFNEPNNLTDRDKALEMATVILTVLEEAGVCPPLVKVPVETHYLDARGTVVRGEDSAVFVNQWEPEDV